MRALRTRAQARDITEQHRTSTPLELLFDLTFVVAVSSLVVELAHRVADNQAGEAIVPFFAVFFAIWWAWNQFTWLSSAYDSDDVPYRIFTMVQMAGVLVLAAGVPRAFDDQDFGAITIGYFIMRLGLVAMLIRVAVEDPESRANTVRHAIGISVVQVGWLLRLVLVPLEFFLPAFILLAVAEMLVSPWAGRKGDLPWHPHHIAERYGLFAIILLGESVLAVTLAVQNAIVDAVTPPLVAVAACGLTLLFALWWLYFSEPAAEGLVKRRDRSYIWGYGHYLIYAALAAIGSGIEVAVEAVGGHVEASPEAVAFALAIPLAVFVLMLWLVHAPLVDRVSIPPSATIVAVVLILLLPLAAGMLGVVATTAALTAVTVALLVAALADGRTHA